MRPRPRWSLTVVVVAIVIGLAVGAYSAWSRWVDRSSLDEARRELAVGRADSARERLSKLSANRPGQGEVEWLLGLAELAAGREAEALLAWSKVPETAPEYPDAALRLAQSWIDQGRFAEAESRLNTALARPGTKTLELRQLLIQLDWHEGRLDEARRLLEANYLLIAEAQGPGSAAAIATLRSHLSIELEAYPIDQFVKMLDDYGAKAPQDGRVKLAKANMATRSGRFEEAAKLLETCLAERPDDPVVHRARLDLGLASGSVALVQDAVAHLSTNDLPRASAYQVAAWLARSRDDPNDERIALETLLAEDPGNSPALERLSELERAAGQTAKATELRNRKSAIDQVKREYRNFLQSDYKANAKAMLEMAETLGRRFEAFAFLSIVNDFKPSRMAKHSIHGRVAKVIVDPTVDPPRPLSERLKLNLASATSKDKATQPSTARSKDERGPTPVFEDLAAASGLNFTYRNGRSAQRQLPETMSGGVGVLDFDGDGLLDVYAIQGGPFPPNPASPHSGDRLFRNKGDGTFHDVTDKAKIPKNGQSYGLGVTVGDFDGDGRPDLFLTRWRSYLLLRNKGDGTFEDRTETAGLAGDRDWPTSAAFADFDNDGDLDLYVCHYLAWNAEDPRPCQDANGAPSYCDPRLLPSLPDHLFRNDRGKFVDVSSEAGIVDRDGRGLGVVAADFNGDGLIDLFVANDGTANFLFQNRGGFKFEEVGHSSGVAGNAEGGFQAGMGVACGDLDGDGLPDLVVTNFYGESTTFHQNLGAGMFADRGASIGLAASTRTLLGFGVALFDANDDGYLDIASTNGHVNDMRPIFPYAMPAQLLLGSRSGRLRDVSAEAGPPWQVPRVGRGLAAADLDNDGRMDLLILSQEEPLAYFHQVGTKETTPPSLTLTLEGTKSNRDGVGAKVTVKTPGKTQVAQRVGGGSYQSSADPRLHFGLGTAKSVDEVEIRWPSGQVDRHSALKAGGAYRLKEANPQAIPLRTGGR